ncbi:MAG: DNA translocase FtsK 4TM domain-containing protein [Anaerolineales bacterium]
MPILKPSSPPSKNQKPATKVLTPKKGGIPAQGKPASKDKFQPPPSSLPSPPPRRDPTWWEKLSPERKLDVVGIVLALFGIIILLGLISANRSAVVGGAIFFLAQIFGWGVYVLPIGLLVFGLWLVFRKIERIPPLSVERAVGSILLYVWLLTVLHIFVSDAENAKAVALTGIGGGALGSVFQRMLWFSIGGTGTFFALIAWLIIGIAIFLDKPVLWNYSNWMLPIFARLQNLLRKPIAPPEPFAAPVSTDGLTPIDLSGIGSGCSAVNQMSSLWSPQG